MPDTNDNNLIKCEAIVVEISSNGNCKVKVESGFVIKAYLSGKLKQQSGGRNRISLNDKVIIEFDKKEQENLKNGNSKARITSKIQVANPNGEVRKSFSARKIHVKRH